MQQMLNVVSLLNLFSNHWDDYEPVRREWKAFYWYASHTVNIVNF